MQKELIVRNLKHLDINKPISQRTFLALQDLNNRRLSEEEESFR